MERELFRQVNSENASKAKLGLLALIGLVWISATIYAISPSTHIEELTAEFIEFWARYGKEYDEIEFYERLEIYTHNLNSIEEHNKL